MYLQRRLVVTWLVPREAAAVSAHVLCTLYNHAPIYSVTSSKATYVRCMSCVASCNLCFWQNGRDLLCATAVTLEWYGYRNKSQHRKLTLEKKILPPLLPGLEPATSRSRARLKLLSYPRSPVGLERIILRFSLHAAVLDWCMSWWPLRRPCGRFCRAERV